MNQILTLAWRNLWRRRQRTLIVVVMIAMGLSGLLSMQGIYDGMFRQMIDDTLRSSTGHLTIQHKDYKISGKLADAVADPEPLAKTLADLPGVKAVSVRVQNEGMAASAKASAGITIYGVHPEREQQFGQFDQMIESGAYTLRSGKNDVVVGADLAKKLGLKVGSKLILTCQSMDRELVSGAFRIRGVIRANNPAIDKTAAFLHFDRAATLFASGTRATRIAAVVDEQTQPETIQSLPHSPIR